MLSDVVVVVDCGLTSHSVIFQLYSYGTDVQFPNFDLLLGTHAMGSYGSLACWAYLDTGTGTSEDVFYLLAIRVPTRGGGKRGIEPGSSDPKSSPLPLRHRGGRYVEWKILFIQILCRKTLYHCIAAIGDPTSKFQKEIILTRIANLCRTTIFLMVYCVSVST